MTLHWWMHWFWVTALLSIQLCSAFTIAAPHPEDLQDLTTKTQLEPETQKLPERQGRAMYYTKAPFASQNKTTMSPVNNSTLIPKVINTSTENTNEHTDKGNNTEMTTEAPEVNVTLEATAASVNMTNNASLTSAKKRNNLTKDTDVKEIESSLDGVSESRIVTEKPLSLETAFLQTRIPPNIEISRRITDVEPGNRMDTGVIAGISFAALAVVALVGSTGFVLYRRRYLNKPQTLNDKCSNPDSSGYLDDSTIRDNSEEMYSLDNDSFLNSLEAMTIQNYWTDTVKHTKL